MQSESKSASSDDGYALKISGNVTREELSRDDSLVKYLAAQDLYGVTMGRKERDTVAGAYQGRGDNRWGLVLLAHLP